MIEGAAVGLDGLVVVHAAFEIAEMGGRDLCAGHGFELEDV